jgi:hypothetical protein
MKDCKKIHPLLPLYRENQLSTGEKAAVEKHIKDCPAAREELKQWQRLGKALKDMPEPQMPRDLHDKIMARLHRKPAPLPNRFWPRASWGLAAAAGLAFIFCVQNFNWLENKNSEIVLKPSSPASVNGVSAKISSQPDMVLKPNRPVNRPAALIAPKQEVAESDVKVQGNAVPPAQIEFSKPIPTMVLALAPQERSKKMKMDMAENKTFQAMTDNSTSAAAPQAAFATGANNNGQPEMKLGLNYQAMAPDMEHGQPVEKQVPQFIRFDIVGFNSNQYQLNWQTDLVTKGQLFVLDSTGNTLQAIAETTPFAYDHQMVIDASKISTNFFIKILATYLNGNQAVTVRNVLKPQ